MVILKKPIPSQIPYIHQRRRHFPLHKYDKILKWIYGKDSNKSRESIEFATNLERQN